RDGVKRNFALRVARDVGGVDPLAGQEIDHLLRKLSHADAAAICNAPVGGQLMAQIPCGIQRVPGNAQPPQPVLTRWRQLDHCLTDGKDRLAHEFSSVVMAARNPSRRIWARFSCTALTNPAFAARSGGASPGSARIERVSASSSAPALRTRSKSSAPRGSSGGWVTEASQASQIAVAKA